MAAAEAREAARPRRDRRPLHPLRGADRGVRRAAGRLHQRGPIWETPTKAGPPRGRPRADPPRRRQRAPPLLRDRRHRPVQRGAGGRGRGTAALRGAGDPRRRGPGRGRRRAARRLRRGRGGGARWLSQPAQAQAARRLADPARADGARLRQGRGAQPGSARSARAAGRGRAAAGGHDRRRRRRADRASRSSIGYLAGTEVDGEKPRFVQVLAPALLMGMMAWGMWRARYWAVLGFQLVLVFLIFSAVYGLALQAATRRPRCSARSPCSPSPAPSSSSWSRRWRGSRCRPATRLGDERSPVL